jgi:hypothetical protein
MSDQNSEDKPQAAHSLASLQAGRHHHLHFQRREETSNLTRDSGRVIISGIKRLKKIGWPRYLVIRDSLFDVIGCSLRGVRI